MDTQQLSAAKQRAEEIHRQIEAHAASIPDVERKIAQEKQSLDAATAKRATLVAELAGADDATRGWAENEIDGLDRQIVRHTRMIESHSASLVKTRAEIDRIAGEKVALGQQISDAERAIRFAAWRERLEQAVRRAGGFLDGSRVELAAVCREAFLGQNEFGVEADRVLNTIIFPFIGQQSGPSARGFELSGGLYADDCVFMIRPMVKR